MVAPRASRLRSGWWRLAVGSAFTLLAISLAVACAVLWVLRTDGGGRWLLEQVPGVQVEAPSGSIFDDSFSAQQVRMLWAGGKGSARLNDVAWRGAAWQWRPPGGAWVGLSIDELRIQRVDVDPGPPSNERLLAPRSLRLPIDIEIKRVQIDALQIGTQEAVHDLQGSLSLGAAGGSEHRLEVHNLRWQHIDGHAKVRIAADPPFALDALLRAESTSGLRWQSEARLSGPLSSFDIKARLNGEALDSGPAPALDLQAQIRPFEVWPLGQVSASTRALDLASLIPQAPRTRINGHALIRSQGLKEPVSVDIEIDNGTPARLGDRGVPVNSVRLTLKADPKQPQRLLIGPFDIQAADQQGAAGRWTGSGVWEGSELTLRTRLSDLQPQRLSAALSAMRLGGPLNLVVRGLPSPDPRATGPAWAGLAGLTAQVDGDWEGSMAAAPQNVRLSFAGEASSTLLALRRLTAASGEARAELSGSLRRLGLHRWQLASTGELQAFDPLTWFPGPQTAAWGRGPHRFNGRWSMDLTAPERLVDVPWAQWLPMLQGQAQVKLIDSRLAGLPLSADLQLRQDAGETAAQRSRARGDIQLGTASLSVEGSGDPQGSGASDRTQLKLQAPALGELAGLVALVPALQAWAPRQGAVQLQADAQGRWPELRTELRASASEARVGSLSLGRGTIQARLDGARGDDLLLNLDLTRLAFEKAQVDSLQADLRGTLASHRLDASLTAPAEPPAALAQLLGWRAGQGAQARLSGTGAWVAAAGGGGRWTGQLERLGVGGRDNATTPGSDRSWLDAQAVTLEASVDSKGDLTQLIAQPGRARSGPLSLRWTEARWQASPEGLPAWRVLADIEPLAVAPLVQALQVGRTEGLIWSGDLRMGAQLDIRADNRFEADIRVQRESGDLLYSDGSRPQALGLSQAEMRLQAKDGQWRFTPRLQGQMLGKLDGDVLARTGAADRWPADNALLEGQVQATVASLGTWSGWLPPGWRLQGDAEAQARLSGRWAAPEYTGFLQARRVAVRNLLEGVDLQDGDLRVRLEGDTARIEISSLRGGEGTLTAEGTARLGAQPQLQLTARADKLRVLSRVDRQLVLTGQANLAAASDRLRLEGRIRADSGLFDLSRRDAPGLDEDVTVQRGEAPVETQEAQRREPSARARNTQVALDIDLGSRLRLRGRGLDTGLAGTLKLSAPLGRLALNGTVRAENGTYAAYGQKLSIERGLVVFNGPMDGARLDILALRPNLDIRVGVAISGVALDPRVRLYSEPDMAETDKLSWLVLGRGPEGLGRTDTALLQRAALALLAGEGESPTDGVLRALGLDDFSIRQSDGEVRETVVTVGKQLSRRWYVGYERGVNATSGTWQLVYRAAQRFTLRAQSGYENSLDLIWTWRFGKNAEASRDSGTPP